MPSSYQAPMRRDFEKKRTFSQSTKTNLPADTATVENVLERKGKEVFSIRPQETLHKAVEILRDRGIGALVVTDLAGQLQGILSERDIVRKLAETPEHTLPRQVSEVMTEKAEVCTPSEPLVLVLQRMNKGRFRHLPVVENDRLIGMITVGDVVNHRLEELEHEALQLKQMIVG